MVWRKLNHAWLSSSSISKLRFSSIIMLSSYSSIESPFWLDYSGDSYVAGFFLNPKSERLEIQEIFLAFRVFFSRLKIQSERTIWWALQSMQIFLHFSVSQQDLDQTRIFLERQNPLGLRQKKWRYKEWGQYFSCQLYKKKKNKIKESMLLAMSWNLSMICTYFLPNTSVLRIKGIFKAPTRLPLQWKVHGNRNTTGTVHGNRISWILLPTLRHWVVLQASAGV